MIGSEILSRQGVYEKFQREIRVAKSNDCLLIIKVIPATDLVDDYQAGKKQLRSQFIIHEQYLK